MKISTEKSINDTSKNHRQERMQKGLQVKLMEAPTTEQVERQTHHNYKKKKPICLYTDILNNVLY